MSIQRLRYRSSETIGELIRVLAKQAQSTTHSNVTYHHHHHKQAITPLHSTPLHSKTQILTVVCVLHVGGRVTLEGAEAQAGDAVEHSHSAAQAVVAPHLAVAAEVSEDRY